LQIYWKKYKNSQEVIVAVTEEHAGVQPLTRQANHNLKARLEETGKQ
jgi:hypothetical protein